MERIEKLLKMIDVLFEWASALSLAFMMVLMVLQVLFRYVLSSPLAWTEELARFTFIWVTFLAGYLAARKGEHIGITFLQDKCPDFLSRILRVTSSLISSAFFGIVFYYCASLWGKLMKQTSAVIGIPMAFIYLSVMVGCGFMCFWYLLCAVNVVLEPKKERSV